MDNQLLILNLQTGAAILMGIDYFVPKVVMRRLAKKIRADLKTFKTGFSSDMMKDLYALLETYRYLVRAIIPFGLLGLFTYEFQLYQYVASPIGRVALIGASALLSSMLFIALAIALLRFLPYCVGAVIFVLLFFIDKSPKGPVAAIGMLLLGISIALKYFSLSPTTM